jgi:hypothetical protein
MQVNCVDLLETLTRHVLGTAESEDLKRFERGKTDKIKQNYVVISSTMRRYQVFFTRFYLTWFLCLFVCLGQIL